MAANSSTVRLSSGISPNILDFRLPQKHVLKDVLAWKPVLRAGAGEGPGVNQQRHGARRAMCVNPGESPWEFR